MAQPAPSVPPASPTLPPRVRPGSTNRSRFSVSSPPDKDEGIRRDVTQFLKRGGRPWDEVQSEVRGAIKRNRSRLNDSNGAAGEVVRYYVDISFLREEDGKLVLVNPPAKRMDRPPAPVLPTTPTIALAAAGAGATPALDADDENAGDPDTDTRPADGATDGSANDEDSGDNDPVRVGHITFRYQDVRSGRGDPLLLMKVSATELAERGLIPRLADDALEGFQRQQRDRQVEGIVKAMRDGIPFPDGVILNLMGEWVTMDGQLIGDDKEFFHVIDGGHRQMACKQLLDANELEVLERYEFPATAVLRASIEVCRMLFGLQDERLRIDSGHMLALRSASGAHSNDNERAAYELARALNARDDSPLKGRIRFGDRGVEGTGTEIVHVGSILVMLKMVVGKRSPFAALDPATREQIVVDFFRAFQATHTKFLDREHVLGQPLGLCALLVVLGNRDHRFHGEVRERRPASAAVAYTVGTMEAAFQVGGRRFHWSPRTDGAKSRTLNHHTLAARYHEFLASKAT